VALLEESMSDAEFWRFLDGGFFEQIGRGDYLILGISDTTPRGRNSGDWSRSPGASAPSGR
jgi:hypothetical protein